jgi:G3E family GTPase
MDLVEQLRDLCHATQQPLNATQPLQNAFDYIVIEASGICEPAPIAQTICSYPSMVTASSAPLPQLDAVVTVVDAMRLRDEFAGGDDLQRTCIPQEDLASLVIQQIEFCNLILLNKASEVTKEELEHIRAIIRAIQPKAKIIDCDYCDVPFGEILDTNLFDFEQVATSATWIQKVEGDIEEEH